ncbi:MAG: HAMP domain-containing histidine kinase [Rhodothermaceae bacterium]|nr:HAMP domain-containing histidine kinase [Rhodothermaceae bacterium]
MRSLRTRWTLALVAVCLLEAVLVFAAVRIGTQRAFDRFIREQAMTGFAEGAADYYRVTGSLDDIEAWVERRGRRSGAERRFNGDGPQDSVRLEGERLPRDTSASRRPIRRFRRGEPPFRFALADHDGRIVLPAGSYVMGDVFTPSEAIETRPLVVDSDTVGTVIRTAESQELGPAEQRFLKETQAAVSWAVAAALLVALLLGYLVARATTRPLRTLTAATEAVARGELEQTVPVRSRDEVGQLAEAFNAMSVRLAEAHALRRRMTADVAHDLRTPLSILTGYLEALRDGTLAATPERIAAMHTEADHLGRLVEDLRTLALADANELTLHRRPVNADALLHRVAEAFRPEAETRGVVLSVEAAEDLPPLDADADRLVQVLGNLVHNALRHTPIRGQITLAARRHAEGVALVVADTGEGIPAEVLPHIFERTVRADTARAVEDGASGLGLAIARSLVEAHGGTIAVKSTEGEGATFMVVLPSAETST